MKKSILISVLITAFGALSFSQDVTTVTAKNDDISENLDLEAVASVFGEAKNLEDFERMLNDPELQISNLDLNRNGEVDYLRVIETSEHNTHLIVIQAVIWKDEYQDVATIEVEKDYSGNETVQVVGDVYLYGNDYIIEPVYVSRPRMYVYLYSPLYNPWFSPYYWGYYPHYYRSWAPYYLDRYYHHIHQHIHVHQNIYHHTNIRNSSTAHSLHTRVGRSDYSRRHPDQSFSNRHTNVRNTQDLRNSRTENVRSDASNNTRNSNVRNNASDNSQNRGTRAVKTERNAPEAHHKSNTRSFTKPTNENKAVKRTETNRLSNSKTVNSKTNKASTTPTRNHSSNTKSNNSTKAKSNNPKNVSSKSNASRNNSSTHGATNRGSNQSRSSNTKR